MISQVLAPFKHYLWISIIFLSIRSCPLSLVLFSISHILSYVSRAAVVHLNFRAETTFPVLVCTVSPGHWVDKADTQEDLPVQQG